MCVCVYQVKTRDLVFLVLLEMEDEVKECGLFQQQAEAVFWFHAQSEALRELDRHLLHKSPGFRLQRQKCWNTRLCLLSETQKGKAGRSGGHIHRGCRLD